MSCVRFRFKSSLEYEKLSFTGLQLSVAELREKIMTEKKLGTASDFTLELVDPLNGKVYKDDNEMISRNASVVVRRVPKLTGNHRLPKTNNRDPTLPNALQDATGQSTLTNAELRKMANLSSANASEEDKVLAMMSQAGADFNPANYAKHKPRGGGGGGLGASMLPGLMRPPPPNYICHRCGQKGHWIKYCPTNGDPTFDNRRVPMKRSVGIPTNQTALASSNMPGAMLDRHGNIVIRTVDLNAVKDKSKSGPSGILAKEESIPPELICSICNELVKEAVIIPCCGESFCDECIRDYLLENEFMCFSCKQMDVSPDTLVPNKKQRAAAKSYLNKMAELKSISVARGLPSAAIAMSALSDLKEPLVALKKTFPSYSIAASVPTTSGTSSSPSNPSPAPVKDEPASPPHAEPNNDGGSGKEEAGSGDEVGVVSEPLITAPVTIDEPSKTTSSSSSGGSPKRNIPTEPIFSSHRSSSSGSRSLSTATSTFSSRIHPSIPHHSSLYHPPSLPLPLPLGLNPNHSLLHPLQAQLPLGRGALSTGPLSLLPPHIPSLPMHVPHTLANPQLQDMARLTEIIAAAERGSLHDGGASSTPPLSLEEFYRQQSLMRRRNSYSRTPSFSRSVTPVSRRSSRSYSWSRSPSRSRSRSPIRHSHHSRHNHREDRGREGELARSPRSNGHTHTERSQHKRKRSRDSDYKEHSKRPRHHHSHKEKAQESDGPKTSSGDITSEVDQKTSSSHRHKSKRKHKKEREHRHADKVENPEEIIRETKVPEAHENGVEEGVIDEMTAERIIDVNADEILAEDATQEDSSEAPVLENHKDKKSDRKSEKKHSRKRNRDIVSSIVGVVVKSSSDEAKVSSSSSSHKKHRHHHSHKEKRKHKQKHRSSSHKK